MMSNIIVTVQEEDAFNVYTTNVNPSYVESMNSIGDVDLSTNGKIDGSVLVYKETTNKWTATRLLNQQIMDAGEF